jgi:hypothetical protein
MGVIQQLVRDLRLAVQAHEQSDSGSTRYLTSLASAAADRLEEFQSREDEELIALGDTPRLKVAYVGGAYYCQHCGAVLIFAQPPRPAVFPAYVSVLHPQDRWCWCSFSSRVFRLPVTVLELEPAE